MKSASCRRSQRNSPLAAAERMPQTLTVMTRIRQSYDMQQYQLTFIDLALRREALRFGKFTLKSGRESPYFFNAGLFSDGEAAHRLGGCYAAALVRCGPRVRHAVRAGLQGHPAGRSHRHRTGCQHGRNVPYAFNRKEAKDHGEGGTHRRHAPCRAAC